MSSDISPRKPQRSEAQTQNSSISFLPFNSAPLSISKGGSRTLLLPTSGRATSNTAFPAVTAAKSLVVAPPGPAVAGRDDARRCPPRDEDPRPTRRFVCAAPSSAESASCFLMFSAHSSACNATERASEREHTGVRDDRCIYVVSSKGCFLAVTDFVSCVYAHTRKCR